MRILIDIGHPGHVHLFRPFTLNIQKKGYDLLFTCRQKEFEIELLEVANFKYISFGKHYKKKIGKIWGLFKFDFKMLITAMRFKPDVFLSHGSIYASHIAFLTKKPHISFEDTFNFEQIRLYKPFTSAILTSAYNHPNLGKKNFKYDGYHELAYLHPNRFLPNKNIINELGLEKGDKYCILRFVSWEATHDYRHNGISLVNKFKIVTELSKTSTVFISSEKQLPKELKCYKFPLAPEKMHSAIAFASLIFGESATMATEGAVLGVPAIYIDSIGRLYTNDIEEKYGLIYNFDETKEGQKKAIIKAVEIVKNNNTVLWKKKQKQLISEKIDVTAFLIWFIENYPTSKDILKENPDYQYNFQ